MKRKKALELFKYPSTQTQVRSLLGMCNVYRGFVKDFAKISSPLNELPKKGTSKNVGPPTAGQEKAFNSLKIAPVHQLPRHGNPYTLDTDASADQLGCVLQQKDDDGVLKPVVYWSRTLIPAERNYPTTERECLGVFGPSRFCEITLTVRASGF